MSCVISCSASAGNGDVFNPVFFGLGSLAEFTSQHMRQTVPHFFSNAVLNQPPLPVLYIPCSMLLNSHVEYDGASSTLKMI